MLPIQTESAVGIRPESGHQISVSKMGTIKKMSEKAIVPLLWPIRYDVTIWVLNRNLAQGFLVYPDVGYLE